MQAVILAAGKSTRTYPLTLTRPKSLIPIANKTILEHQLEMLKGLVDEVILVVGYKKEMIEEFLKGKDFGFKITFAEQKEQNGTGGALLTCKDMIKGKFISMYGDDLYSRKDLEKCLKHDYCIMAKEAKFPERFGVLELNGKKVISIEEKPEKPKSNIVNIGLYVLHKKIFDFELEKSPRGEYELPDFVNKLVEAKEEVFCEVVEDYWIPVGYPWHILNANEFFVERIEEKIEGTIEKNTTIKGTIQLGKGSVIKNGTYIEGNAVIGKNTVIGPNCYIRGKTSIGDNCKVGNAVEIKNCVLMNRTHVGHLSYVGDSVLGENVNFGAGTITANLRHDNVNVKSLIKGKKEDSGRRKLGVIIGDNVHTGINTSFYPGVKISPNATTLPGEQVKEDK